MIKRALENSARFLDQVDIFAQGHGLLQVERAFEYLLNYHSCPARDVRFAISCGIYNSKGIHVRTGLLTQPIEYSVTIEPCFKDCVDIDPQTKINFGLHLALICKGEFVQCPAFLDLQNLGRTISVKIDPSGLTSGIHFTSIEAYDVSCVEKGPLFSIPITVVQPEEFSAPTPYELQWKSVQFKPNTIKRHFIVVPTYATWAVLHLRCVEHNKQGRFVIHCVQLRPKQSCKSQEFQKMTLVTSNSDTMLAFPVKGDYVLEVVIAKFWANLGDVELDYSLSLHGIKPDTTCVSMQAVDGLHQIELRCLRAEEIAPVITLKSSVQVLRYALNLSLVS